MTTDGAPAAAHQGVRLSRTLPAPPERVWAALTDPAQLQAWFWPSGWDTTVTAEPRVGGHYRIASTQPETAVEGEYLEVSAPHRLVKTWQWDGEDASTVVRIEVLGGEQGSGVVVTHQGLAPDAVAEHEQGWSDCLDRLPGFLAANG